MEKASYVPLHSELGEETINEGSNHKRTVEEESEDEEDEFDNNDIQRRQQHKSFQSKKEIFESFDFTDTESLMWRKHQFRRYYQGKGKFWTASRVTNAWKWILVIASGLIIGLTGAFVAFVIEILIDWKFESCYKLMEEGNYAGAFFSYQFFCLFFALVSGALCWKEPMAAGSGIPEIKAFLNGVNISNIVRMPVLAAKVLGMCFACATGLPLGKEGPMIHSGSIIGCVVSQGYNFNFGYDSSWNTFQDLRNDHTKRDYVTFGAAAGVAAAFRAPIGGILFTLEEGASFWSNSVTFRSFMCAVVTQLTMGLAFPEDATSSIGMFAFGQFDNLFDGRSNYYVYELPVFMAIGALGGVIGALFNHLNMTAARYRKKHLAAYKWKRLVELCLISFALSFVGFVLPICWQVCTPIPDETADTTAQESDLLSRLVQFQCPEGRYNQLASLYFTPSDVTMRQLFHFREVNGVGDSSFATVPLLLFFVPYFLIASITTGLMCPTGLFVPTLLSGAAVGRLIGHWMNLLFPGHVADAGTYALIGASAVMGGVARMTIAGCVIILEACGNTSYLLPLMLTFAAARYGGNAINDSIYDTQIRMKDMPFLEGTLHTLGMLNYHPISKIMMHQVVTIQEVEKVRRVMEILTTTNHNGFPVVSKDGRLRGIILRKTLCMLLKLKAYSIPVTGEKEADGALLLEPAATVAYDALERPYPHYPDVRGVKLSDKELTYWLDVRAAMDPSPHILTKETSIRRCYNLFRTMGLRHIVVVDGDFLVVGIITRADMNEHRLKHYWEEEGETIQKELNLDALPQARAYEKRALTHQAHHVTSGGRRRSLSSDTCVFVSLAVEEADLDMEVLTSDLNPPDSPPLPLRKKLSA